MHTLIFNLLAISESESSLLNGLILTVIGMTVVFFVLGVLSLAIYLVGISIYKLISRPKAEKEVIAVASEAQKEVASEEEIVAAIGAALAAYLMLKKRRIEGVKIRAAEKSLWNMAAKLESMNPEYSISRMNLDEVVIEEHIRGMTK